ncbi:hypothetical protein HS088_TW13G00376 [Tripterygium wilfordii]|uniref:Uncharacterized protein n=1 Tax=Tripterygium wilfordii TaxID=458696 RepID=A0A7J7CTP3_TRIWF|nr:uncharacterized protein LOC120012797 [Tripterygium wilfordii]XP_038720224.1 uncharacterized protein LOC120012797 [Tripterygium wilfordii]XP_038720225.1 uncharacterized protein LOC120012797 [Tripterygium wilfordii]KAF5737495.1 hypothetical protein HS088_TW13G00376 [Tripterygium wilfordii]
MPLIQRKGASVTDSAGIGILAFEVASLMSKLVNLWHYLNDKEFDRMMREEILNSIGIQRLVANDNEYLMDLVLDEIIENFGIVAQSVARIASKCTDPIYHRFEHFISDPIRKGSEWLGWEYRLKKMEKKVKKMKRFVTMTFQLSQELEVLVELEQTFRRMEADSAIERVKLLEFQKKVMWQRQEVKYLQEMSLWGRTHDYIVRLLARSLFTILERIKHVFEADKVAAIERNNDSKHLNTIHLSRSYSSSAHTQVYSSEISLCGLAPGHVGRKTSKLEQTTDGNTVNYKQSRAQHDLNGKYQHLKTKNFPNAGPFKGCMTAGSDSPILQSCKPTGGGSMRFTHVHLKNVSKYGKLNGEALSCSDKVHLKLLLFSSKRVLSSAPPSTLGDAALALHYANVIILIEKLTSSSHMIGLDARDDLYNMLPTSIRTSLRSRLKSYAKSLASSSSYDSSLAAEWSLALAQILEWLVPLAHNTIKWHSERNFEKEHAASRTNVLLVQTLHYANQAKTEATITELLLGLNYIYRIRRELNDRVETAVSEAPERGAKKEHC